MRTFFQDIRYGVRGLLHNRAFTIVAVLSLALGIGANTAIFSLVNAVLFKSLPLHEPENLVMLWEDASFANFPRNSPAPANYVDWKAQNKVFSDMAALDSNSLNLTGDGEPERVSGYSVTANFFPLLGVEPMLGRSFTSEEDKAGANNVVIISHGLWQSRYGGQRDIINRDILLNNQKYKVVGVMPANFQFLGSYIKVWTPLTLNQEEWAERGSHYLTVVARLKQGTTLEQARADMQTIMQRIATDHPKTSRKIEISRTASARTTRGRYAPTVDCVDSCSWFCVVDCVRQHCESFIDACSKPSQRDSRPNGYGSEPLANRKTTTYRKCFAVTRGRRTRFNIGDVEFRFFAATHT